MIYEILSMRRSCRKRGRHKRNRMSGCLVTVRNVPCYKCSECNEIIYSADVVQRLEKIIETAKKLMQEISIIDYSHAA